MHEPSARPRPAVLSFGLGKQSAMRELSRKDKQRSLSSPQTSIRSIRSIDSSSMLRRPVRRPSVESDTDWDDNIQNDDQEKKIPETTSTSSMAHSVVEVVVREAIALAADDDDDDDDSTYETQGRPIEVGSCAERGSNIGDESLEKKVDADAGDDDDEGNESVSTASSEKTEVTNNKSIAGTIEVKRKSGISTSPQHDSFSVLSPSLDGSAHNEQRRDRREHGVDDRPFKGNPSRQERLERERRREKRLKRKKDKKRDIDFDLRSKPGCIHVVDELDEGFGEDTLSPGTSRSRESGLSRKSGITSGNNTHTSTSSDSSIFFLTEERIRSHMKDYYEDFDSIFKYGKSSKECWEAFFRQYFTDDILWVRSTGNPIGREGLAQLLADDIVGISMAAVSIDSIQLLAGGQAAVVVFTADQEYFYRGVRESDRTVITSVLHVANGCEILIGHEHRCVGKPIPKDTRWET